MSHTRRFRSRLFSGALAALAFIHVGGGLTEASAQPSQHSPAAAAAAPAPGRPGGKPADKARPAKPGKPIAVDVAAESKRLVGADVEAAVAAARALGDSTDKAAREALLDALALGLDPRVTAAALGSLVRLPDASVYDVAAFYASYRNAKVRAAAVSALGALDDSRAVAGVLQALHDSDKDVRAAAAEVVARRKLKQGIEPLLALLKKGDDAAGPALATLADPDLARSLGDLIGTAPDGPLARCLGAILLRTDFGAEPAKLELVRALGKVPGPDAVEQLAAYIEATPEKPPRQSRREAEALVDARLTGDK
jgi:HEAT repeat protein